uniref:Uncharacterized protein n=1 Tax=Rhizophora mucronata TaxID=61149 RepID=A0A2P2KRB8_RHIMU
MCLWFPQGRHRAALLPLPPPRRSPSVSRSKSGTPSPSGPGILLSITARFAETISWISVLSAKPIRLVPPARNALLLGGFATMHFTFTASADGSRLVKCVHWITVNGSSRSMATRIFRQSDGLQPSKIST